MKKKMSKRGSNVILMIFEVIVVILVISIAFSVVQGYAKSNDVAKVKYAEEVSLMVNVLVATPGDASIKFPWDVTDFVLQIDGGSVVVFFRGETSPEQQVRRAFILPDAYSALGAVSADASRACMKKIEKSILLEECA